MAEYSGTTASTVGCDGRLVTGARALPYETVTVTTWSVSAPSRWILRSWNGEASALAETLCVVAVNVASTTRRRARSLKSSGARECRASRARSRT